MVRSNQGGALPRRRIEIRLRSDLGFLKPDRGNAGCHTIRLVTALSLRERRLGFRDVFIGAFEMKDYLATRTSLENYSQGDYAGDVQFRSDLLFESSAYGLVKSARPEIHLEGDHVDERDPLRSIPKDSGACLTEGNATASKIGTQFINARNSLRAQT